MATVSMRDLARRAGEVVDEVADSRPGTAAEELADIGHLLSRQAQAGGAEEVTEPEEIALVEDALRDPGAAVEFAPEQAIVELAARRQRRRA